MNLVQLGALIPPAAWALLISANAIPYLSALVTRRPGWWTGACTVVLSLVGSVVTAVAQGGSQGWKYVASLTAITWVVARLHLNTFVKGTQVEQYLHARGVKK